MCFCFIFYKVFAGALQGEPKNNIFQEKFVSSQFGIHIAQLNLMVSDWDFPKKDTSPACSGKNRDQERTSHLNYLHKNMALV
jgi:hypothetical protein